VLGDQLAQHGAVELGVENALEHDVVPQPQRTAHGIGDELRRDRVEPGTLMFPQHDPAEVFSRNCMSHETS
jgi:hypothetical protein